MDRPTHRPLARALGLLVALATVAVACSSDDEPASADPPVSGETPGPTDRSDGTSDPAPPDDEPFEVTAAIGEQYSRLDTQAGYTAINRFSVGFGNVGEGLAMTNADGELEPLLATSWELIDDLTWRYELRDDVSFSNGEPFDAAAAKFSIERIASDEYGATHIAFFTPIEGVTVVDEHTIDVNVTQPTPDLPLIIALVMMVPPEYTGDFSPDGPQEQHPIGTGPYLLASRSPDTVVMTKNEDYWGGDFDGPDQVTVISRPEASSRVAAMQAGELDVIDAVPLQSLGAMPNVLPTVPGRMLSVQLNLTTGITSDIRVRQALMMAVDHATMREALMGDTAITAQCQLAVPGIIGFNPNIENLAYDPDAARDLIEEAGATGASIRFVVSAGVYPSGEEAAEIIASQWESIGLDVDLQIVDRAAWRAASQAPVEERVETFLGAAGFDMGSVSQVYGPYLVRGGALSSIPFDDHLELEQALLDALTESDPDVREQMLQENSAALCEIVPYIPLWGFGNIVAHADGIAVPARQDQNFPWKDVRRTG